MKDIESNIENKMEYKLVSPAKLWLIGIFSFLVALNLIILIGELALSSESGIGLGIIGLVIYGVIIVALRKEWRVALNIGPIFLVIGMVSSVIGLVLEGIAFNAIDDPKLTQTNLLIVNGLILYVALAGNGSLLVAIVRYPDYSKSDSYDEL